MPGRLPEFDWRVFADATCAGLSVLIPIPLVDVAFERFFVRRMPASICRARGLEMSPSDLEILRRSDQPWMSAQSCLTVPLAAGLWLLKRLSRKILYFLTVREAVEELSAHWHRAHLLDHAARSGHLRPGAPAIVARLALEQTLEATNTSPLAGLARTTVRGAPQVLRLLLRARRQGPGEGVRAREAELERHWADVAGHFERMAQLYDVTYNSATTRTPAASAP